MTAQNIRQPLITSFVAFCIIAALVVGVQATKPDVTNSSDSSQPSVAGMNSRQTTSQLADGDYQATGKYSSPGGPQTLDVQLKLSGNKISAASVTPSAKDGVAQLYQQYFVENFMPLVVGKDINDVKLSRVAGSSLTSKGFNDALAKVKQQANQ